MGHLDGDALALCCIGATAPVAVGPDIQRPIRVKCDRVARRIVWNGLLIVVVAGLVPFPDHPGNIFRARRPACYAC